MLGKITKICTLSHKNAHIPLKVAKNETFSGIKAKIIEDYTFCIIHFV